MKNLFIRIFVFFLILGFANTGFAFTYSEPPDLRSSGIDYLGILSLGTNTVSGNLDSYGSASSDLDSFTFTLAQGMYIDSIQFDFSVGQDTNSSIVESSFRLEDDNGDEVVDFGMFDLLASTPPIIIPNDLSGLAPGLYELHNYLSSKVWNRNVDVDYTWTITTASAIPVPGAVWLLISGLVGLAGFKKRSDRHRCSQVKHTPS